MKAASYPMHLELAEAFNTSPDSLLPFPLRYPFSDQTVLLPKLCNHPLVADAYPLYMHQRRQRIARLVFAASFFKVSPISSHTHS